MASNDLLKKLVDAGMTFTAMSQSRAESLVKDLVKQGDLRKKEAKKFAGELVERGREGAEQLIEMVQAEVAKQLGLIAQRIDGVEDRIEDLADKLGIGSKPAANVAAAAASAVTTAAPAAKKAAAPAKRAAPAAKKAAAPAAEKAAAPVKKAAAKKSAS